MARHIDRSVFRQIAHQIHGVVYAPPSDACPACGGGLRQLGEDVAEQLEFVPASFRVIRHVRPKLACSCCDAIVQASAPSRPIERGIAGPGLLAHVLVAKFADHLPLYRQSLIYAREGVDLDRALLASWVGAASALLRPLVDAIRRHVLAAAKLHADDTPIPVLAPGNGKTKTARLSTYVRDDRHASDITPPAVWFAYTPDRKGIHPQTHLARFEGVLQADAYAGFNALFEDGVFREAACWAHARRKFYDLHAARPTALTTEALRRIAELYVSKPRSGASHPINDDKFGKPVRAPYSTTWNAGCAPRSTPCRASPTRRQQSSTRTNSGRRCCATATTAPSRSTTRRPNAPCAALQ